MKKQLIILSVTVSLLGSVNVPANAQKNVVCQNASKNSYCFCIPSSGDTCSCPPQCFKVPYSIFPATIKVYCQQPGYTHPKPKIAGSPHCTTKKLGKNSVKVTCFNSNPLGGCKLKNCKETVTLTNRCSSH